MRCAIYSRVSTVDKGQDPENQLLQLRAFIDTQQWKHADEYVDYASGKTADRNGFNCLFMDASQRRFDVVLFWALDRFSREGTLPTLQYLQRLDGYGVAYRSFTEPWLDSCGMFKDVIISLLATLAKQERIRISERTVAGLERARSQGKKLGRPRLTIDAGAVDRAYQDLKESGILAPSRRAIARKLGVSAAWVAKAAVSAGR